MNETERNLLRLAAAGIALLLSKQHPDFGFQGPLEEIDVALKKLNDENQPGGGKPK